MGASFADKLSALCASELIAARKDPERAGAMIERLTHSLGFTIAIIGAGNSEAMSTLLQGAESYLTEAAAENVKVAKLLEGGIQEFDHKHE